MSLSIIKKKGFVEKAALLSTNFGALDNHFYIDGELQSYPAGIAHFLEHKLFEDEQGRDVTLDFVKLGADVNAFTTLEKTTYYFSTLDNFEESLELLLNFTSSFTVISSMLSTLPAMSCPNIVLGYKLCKQPR